MKKFFSPKRVKLIALVVVLALVLTPAFLFLDSIHYDIGLYIEYGFTTDRVKFREHREEFELLAEQLYLFVDSRPDFFEEFDETFYIRKDELRFYKKRQPYPESEYSHPVTVEGWADAANNYHDAFPEKVFSGEVGLNIYPNCISFYNALIYTRDGKYPQEIVNDFKEGGSRVLVIKHAKGWYETVVR